MFECMAASAPKIRQMSSIPYAINGRRLMLRFLVKKRPAAAVEAAVIQSSTPRCNRWHPPEGYAHPVAVGDPHACGRVTPSQRRHHSGAAFWC